MNEKVFQTIISDYAMEVANLKITVVTLQLALEEAQNEQNTEEKGEK